jgi:PEGA domain
MRSIAKAVSIALISGSLTLGNVGCATIFTGGRPDQKVEFKSIPQGATVYVDGEEVGQTPLKLPLARDMNHKVRIELAGYPTYERDIKTGFNGWVIGNIVLGGLIGLVIDIVSGSTDSLNPATVKVNFQELAGKNKAANGKPVTTRVAPNKAVGASKPPAAKLPAVKPSPVKPSVAKPAPGQTGSFLEQGRKMDAERKTQGK